VGFKKLNIKSKKVKINKPISKTIKLIIRRNRSISIKTSKSYLALNYNNSNRIEKT